MPDSSGTGITGPVIPTVPGVAYGAVAVNESTRQQLNWDYFTQTQEASVAINGMLHIYHDLGHGLDRYLVIYLEQGSIDPGTPSIAQQALPLAGRDGQDLAQGFWHRASNMSVSVSANNGNSNGVSWAGHGPTNMNTAVQESKQVVSSVSSTLSVNKDGPSGSTTEEEQTWSGQTFTLTEWGIDDLTDASLARPQWFYYQNQPWDGHADPGQFGNWWKDAFNMGGGWDDVKHPTHLSTVPLEYSNIAGWYFDSSMKAADGTLQVTFTGQVTQHLVGVNMPQLLDNGHHQIWPRDVTLNWSRTVDLASAARQV